MGTNFTDIYDINEILKLDTRLLGKPDNIVYSWKYKWLKYAISIFENDCYKDLSKITPFSQIEYEFISDGIKNEYILTPIPITDSSFYVSVDNSDDYSYTYNKTTNTLTISPIPILNSNIYISAYIIGSFDESLNFQEQTILSEAMIIPYLEQERNRSELLNMMVYSGDAKIYSQANHLDTLNNIVDNQYYKRVRMMITDYSYKQNPNNSKGLSGSGGVLQ